MDIAIVAGLLATPILLHFFLNSSGSLSLLALCGSILLNSSLTNGSLPDWLGATVQNTVDNPGMGILVVSIPYVITIFLTAGKAKGSAKVVHFIPAIAAAVIYASAVVPLLAQNAISTLTYQNQLWDYVQNFGVIAAFVGIITALLIIWFGGPKSNHDKHK